MVLGSSCGVWCMNVYWIVMVCSCGGGVCVIRVVIVMGWLGSGGECMVVVVLVIRRGNKALLTLDVDCGCHWLVVAHGSGDGVMMMTVIVVVYIPSCTTIY